MVLSEKWQFLTSPRFWSVVLIALAQWLAKDGFVTTALAGFITTVAGGYTIIRTIDRNSGDALEKYK